MPMGVKLCTADMITAGRLVLVLGISIGPPGVLLYRVSAEVTLSFQPLVNGPIPKTTHFVPTKIYTNSAKDQITNM